jgi:hypothetical protein
MPDDVWPGRSPNVKPGGCVTGSFMASDGTREICQSGYQSRCSPSWPLRRQDEPELMAQCADTGVGVVPYSPNGKGRLARPWGEQSTRSS